MIAKKLSADELEGAADRNEKYEQTMEKWFTEFLIFLKQIRLSQRWFGIFSCMTNFLTVWVISKFLAQAQLQN